MSTIGAHINREYSKSKRLIEHLKNAKFTFGISVFSVFVSETRRRRIIISPDEVAELRVFSRDNVIIAHSNYVSSPWTGNDEAIQHVRDEMRTCADCGFAGFVVHLPKSGLAGIEHAINNIIGISNIRLYLETPAVIESEYAAPDKLIRLYKFLHERDPEGRYTGICIDTAHLHTNGIALRTRADAMGYFDAILAEIPTNALMFHLNDSEREIHTGPDSHAPLMKGKIWGGINYSDSGLCVIVDIIKKFKIPTILERDHKDLIRPDLELVV